MKRTALLSVGKHRDNPRIWIEGKYLNALGFTQGKSIDVEYGEGKIVITLTGCRKMSGHRDRPVLDLNSSEISEAIGSAEVVEVRSRYGVLEIVPAEVEQKRLERQVRTKTVGSIFSGGGLLDEAATRAGFTPTFGVEINEEYGEVFQENHSSAELFLGSISDVPLKDLPRVELLVGGIPCECFSKARRNKGKDTLSPDDHPLVDMTVWALMVVRQVNPRVVVFEEVPGYLDHSAYKILSACLKRMAYTVEARVVDGTIYGSLCVRKRAVIVAKNGPIKWPEPFVHSRTLGEILLDPRDSRCQWFDRKSKPWLFEHWEVQGGKGNGFSSTVLTENSRTVPAITKRYFAEQGGNPVVPHPNQPGVYRWLTVVEVQRLMGLKDGYKLGDKKRVAGEVMGQGVLVDVFNRIIASVTR